MDDKRWFAYAWYLTINRTDETYEPISKLKTAFKMLETGIVNGCAVWFEDNKAIVDCGDWGMTLGIDEAMDDVKQEFEDYISGRWD